MENINDLRKQLEEERQLRLNAEKLCQKQQELLNHKLLSNEILNTDLESILLDNARLNSIVKNLPLGVLIEDYNRKIVLTNHVFCQLFGIPIDPDLMIGYDCNQAIMEVKSLFVHEENLVHEVDTILKNRKVVLDQKLFLKDDRVFTRSYIPIINADKYSGHLWIYEDVTFKHRFNEGIITSSNILNEYPYPVLRCDFEGSIIYANTAFEKKIKLDSKNILNEELLYYLKKSIHQNQNAIQAIEINGNVFDIIFITNFEDKYVNIYLKENIASTINDENKLLIDLINESTDAILCIDEFGSIVFANFESAQRFNCSLDILKSKNVLQLNIGVSTIEDWTNRIEKIKKNELSIIHADRVFDNKTISVEIVYKYISINNKGYIIAVSRNVSERIKSINQLQQQQVFYETILNNLPADIAVFDTQHRYLFVNPIGIKNDEIRSWIIGKTDKDYCLFRNKNLEIADRRISLQLKAINNQTQVEWEETNVNPDQSISYYLRRYHPIVIENVVTMLIGYGINITDRKLIENKLIESEERYRLVIDASNDCIWDWDIASGKMFLSDRWKSMLGYMREEILEESIVTWYSHLHNEDLKIAIRAFYDHFLSNEPFFCTLRFIHKNKQIKWMMCRGTAIRDYTGKPIRMVGTCTDITSLKNIESQLKASEDKLSIIFNNSYDASFIVNKQDLKILECNQSTIDLFKFNFKQQVIHLKIFDLFYDDILELWPEIEYHLVTNGFFESEIKSKKYDNEIFWANVAIRTLTINAKDVLLVRVADISKQKNLEQELRKAKAYTEESAKSKELFLANVSHEIRTPMNGIIGLLDLFDQSNLGENQLKYFELIKRNSNNLLFILNDILDFSKLESGKFKIESTTFNLIEVIQNAYNLFKLKTEEKGIVLNIDIPSIDQLWLKGDPYRLSQILLNLISNAIKFTEKGHVTIKLELKELTNNQIKTTFKIIDTGIGIDSNNLKLIFEGFEQAESSIARNYGGTGLGLSISKKLIELQAGNIYVDSELNKGSTFTFELTYQQSIKPGLTDEASQLDWTNVTQLKILLAEDNEVNQFLIKEMLLIKGVNIDVVPDGEEAIKKINQEKYDLILLDIQMPKVNGIEVINYIKNNKNVNIAKLPIIVLTANGTNNDNIKYIDLGAFDYLSKPFDSKKLYDKILSCIKKEFQFSESQTKKMNYINKIKSVEGLFDFTFFDQSMINDAEFIKSICKIFVNTTPPQLKDMLDAYNTNDWKRLASVAHKLKTTITSFHIEAVKSDIIQIEQNALAQSQLSETKMLVDQVVIVVEKVIFNISEQLKKN